MLFKGGLNMEKKEQKKDEQGRVIMTWPTPEDKNKSWGHNGYDVHFIKKG